MPPTLLIDPVPAFKDNYIWLLHREQDRSAWVVDPGEASGVLERLQQLGLKLEGALITHHHPDHDSGVPVLRAQYPALRVVGGLEGRSKHLTERLAAHATLRLLDHTFELLEVPGHTLDHIAFYCADAGALFCGDTLFTGGCGRLFEGTPAELHQSLEQIARLPPATRVYCAHEYTASNLRFALAVEPGNLSLQERSETTAGLRAAGQPTVPSSLLLELATNPFLRCREPSIMAAVREQLGDTPATPLAVFTALRAWKDRF